MVRWQPRLTLLLVILCTGGIFSCMEMVRRAEPSSGKPDPWWGQGNPPEPEGVSNEETSSGTAEPAVAVGGGPSMELPVEVHHVTTVGPSGQSLAEAHTKRGKSREKSTRQINEYAYWCIENNMWDEARLHLEKAVGHDSLSASLFNNLGVIYERLGETGEADSAYARATALVPQAQAYAVNLRRLRERAEAAVRAVADSVALEAASTDSGAGGSATDLAAQDGSQ